MRDLPMTNTMRRLLAPGLLGLVLALLLLAPAARAQSAPPPQVPCIPGTEAPLCYEWTGRVTFVADGDTIDVDLDGDATPQPVHVRLTGIQAMEQAVYSRVAARRRGECHAVEATARLEELLHAGGDVVRLTALNPASHSGERLVRSVAVQLDGQWRDVGQILLAQGHVLPFPLGGEWAWNAVYSTLGQQVARTGARIWDPAACGGPPAAVSLFVHWDAEGSDALRPDDEWVRVRNLDTAPLDLSGWLLRDSSLNRFWFPAGTVLGPGATITVQVGVGGGALLSWGLGFSIFGNVSNDGRATGDGAFLLDPQGDLRAWMLYPCRVACTDPRTGNVELRVQPTGRELITLRNVGDAPIDLDGSEVRVGAHGYAFAPATILQPGESLRLRTDGSPANDAPLDRSWGGGGSLLPNAGGTARLLTFDGIELACRAWGGGSC